MPLAWPEIAESGEFAAARPIFRLADFAGWRARITKDPWKTIASTQQIITQKILASIGVTT
jgi:hypothetical protein